LRVASVRPVQPVQPVQDGVDRVRQRAYRGPAATAGEIAQDERRSGRRTCVPVRDHVGADGRGLERRRPLSRQDAQHPRPQRASDLVRGRGTAVADQHGGAEPATAQAAAECGREARTVQRQGRRGEPVAEDDLDVGTLPAAPQAGTRGGVQACRASRVAQAGVPGCRRRRDLDGTEAPGQGRRHHGADGVGGGGAGDEERQ
jgi:hypothetical protein